jgi:hypothetical protein
MPLARIITESADDSLELTMQLRARGFVVETVSPDKVPGTPADLEVRMEEGSPEEVLNRAAAVSENEDLWVFVAPGALDERSRPIRTIPLVPHAFDVPIPRTIPTKFETTWPAAVIGENGLSKEVAPGLTAMPMRVSAEIPMAPGNGGGKRELVADLKNESATVPPVIVSSAPAMPAADVQPKVKVAVLPKLSEAPQIPEVLARAEPMNVAPTPKVTPGRVRLRGPYKISFRTGAPFWKTIAVSAVLVVLAGLLVAAIALRPHLAQSAKPATSTGPAAAGARVNPTKPVSTGVTVKSSTAPVGASSQIAAPAVPPAAGRATAQVPGPSVPQIPAKPVHESAVTAVPKRLQDTPQNAPAKPASPVANNPNKALPVRRHTGSSEADIVAEDTVVFYNHKPASSVSKTPQESGVKQ